MSDSELAANMLVEARSDLAFDQPFYGCILIRLKMVEENSIPTLAVDGKNIYYNVNFVTSLSMKKLKGVLIHEVLHVIMLHHTRRGSRDPKKWNVACDYAINPIAVQDGFELPEGALLDATWYNKMAEYIYDALPKNEDPSGETYTYNLNGDTLTALDEIVEPKTEIERIEAELEAKELQTTAQLTAKAAGKMPASLDRIIDKLQKPQVRWQEEVRQFLTDRTRGKPMWHIANQRLVELAHLPYYSRVPSGNLVIAFDTSGSVDVAETRAYASEIREIGQDNSITGLDVLFIDTKVQRHQHFDMNQEIELRPKGGGGTRFAPAFKWIEDNNIKPHALIYFTDGEARFPEEPDYPVIWCMTSDTIAPWGKTVTLENF